MSDNNFESNAYTVKEKEVTQTNQTVSRNPNYSSQRIDIRKINKYQFVTEAYEGSAGFCDGSYLLPHAREAWYQERQTMSYYRNYIRPITNAIVDPVFDSPVLRETDSELYKAFLQDVDVAGTNINDHVREVVRFSRLHGNCFVVMENFADQPDSMQEAINNRILPYVYIQPAYTVYDYTADQFGNLVTITFHHTESYVDKNDKKKTVVVYKTWTDMDLTIVKKDGNTVVSHEIIPHDLGILPVIQAPAVGKEILPFAPFYDISRINYAIFNKDSEIRDQERAQAFSILYIQTDAPQNGIVLGPHNAIILPASDQINITPGFVSPDSSILKTLVENNKELVDAMFKAAQQQGVVAIKQATSGIAEAYRFTGTNAQLNKSATIATSYENDLVKLFNIRTNQNIEYTVRYSKEYSPAISAQNIDLIVKLLDMEINDAAKTEIRNVLIKEVLSHLDQEDIDKLLN